MRIRSILSAVLMCSLWNPHLAMSAVINVPEAGATINYAINVLAVAGDVVSVRPLSTSSDYFERITLKSGVRVEARAGYPAPVLNGAGTSLDMVTFPVLTGSGTVLSGFKIKNFTGTGIAFPSGGTNIGRVEKCIVEGGTQGIFTYQACEIVECTLTGQSATAIMCQGINHALSLVQDNLITQSAPNSYGIRHDAINWRGPRIKNNTVGGSQFGIYIRGSLATATPVENNLVVYCTSEGISCAFGAVTPTHNYAFGNGINYINCGGNPPPNNSAWDPILCNQALYTIDINSPAAIANNIWGERVGKKGNVGCATLTSPSQLLNNTTLSDGEVVDLLQDFIIPVGKTLTLNAGVTIAADELDELHCGLGLDMVELIVEGNLYVNGTATNRVKFISKNPPGHDWYAITNTAGVCPIAPVGGGIYINYAEVRNSEYGVYFITPTSGSYVRNSTFYDNEIAIGIYTAVSGDVITAELNTITLSGTDAKGIVLNQFIRGAIVSNNTIIGTALGIAGIDCVGFNPPLQMPTIIGNIISGFSTGKGVSLPLSGIGPKLTKNIISGCKYGIYVSGGATPVIGDEADATSDNIVTGNSTAGLFIGGSTTRGKMRQSQFTGNGSGIITKGNSNPDLGVVGDPGNNIVTGNTNYCLWNQSTSGTVSARGNYRGPCDFSICWSGAFDLGDALCTAPARHLVEVEEVGSAPRFGISQVYPNPLTPGFKSVIALSPGDSERMISVSIHDLGGRLIRSFDEMSMSRGVHSLIWDGVDNLGGPVGSGIYFIRMVSKDGLVSRRKIVVAH